MVDTIINLAVCVDIVIQNKKKFTFITSIFSYLEKKLVS